jgi:hypothetical protein
MADDHEPSGDASVLTAGYEQLRSAVLSGDAGGWRLGHGVLCTRGMTAWMSAVGELALPVGGTAGAATGAEAPAPAGRERPTGQPVALPAADQVVAVLTQMVLPLAA